MSKRNIVLIGFMGTGKTSVGMRLAERLGYRFVDTDRWIEKRAGKAVMRIFAEDGEPFFRDMESKIIAEVSRLSNAVISAGGGAITRSENIRRLQSSGFIVCLTASPNVIYRRIGQESDRPLLQVEKPIEEIKRLLKSREAGYSQADLTLDTSTRDVEHIADEILSAYRHHLQEGS